MSRFADPNAVKTVDLGPCLCPGAPHESDWAKVRAEADVSEVQRFEGIAGKTAGEAADLMAGFIPEWNLLGANGEDWPPSGESVTALKVATFRLLADAVAASVRDSSALPNASGGPSRGSSRGTASKARTTSRTPTT